jgi:hypothetical protein
MVTAANRNLIQGNMPAVIAIRAPFHNVVIQVDCEIQ